MLEIGQKRATEGGRKGRGERIVRGKGRGERTIYKLTISF